MVYSHKSAIFSLCLIAGIFSSPFVKRAADQPWTTVRSEASFCIFLPPEPGQEIAITEDFGIPFCTTENLIDNANLFPEGFIRNAHFAETSNYVQVTGYFDRSKYSLNETDGGGQYDNHAFGKPVGAQCRGYDYFVNLVEPDEERYCIRCCHNKEDCNTGRSGFGCLQVIDGDYTLPDATTDFISEDMEELDLLPFEDLSAQPSDNSILNETIPDLESIKAVISTSDNASNTTITGNISEQWSSLMDYLTENDPSEEDQIEQLKTVALALTTVEQWKAYLELTTDRINKLQGKDDVTTA